MRLAYHGEPGAFGEAACRLHDPGADRVAHATVADAIAAVRSSACDAVVLPVENSVAGPVGPVLALLPSSGLVQVGEVHLPIRMALLGAPGAMLLRIVSVTSHPVALAQCRRVIAELGLREVPAPNTATAAAQLAATANPNVAVLASVEAARIHGLIVLLDDVGDDPAAVTRFVVLERPGARASCA